MNTKRKPLFSVSNEEGCWPTEIQELLLKATLLKGEEALNAWHEWRGKANIDLIDAGSLRLLPLLHKNLKAHGVKDPLMERFKGVHRLYWYRNQMLLRTMAAVLKKFHNAGIRTMILKGSALIQQYYGDYGSRPMSDFDVLIPCENARLAIDLLLGAGWSATSKSKLPRRLNRAHLATRHSVELKDSTDKKLDLHWHVLTYHCYAGADDDFWKGAVPVKFHGVPTCVLNPADQLLHVCMRGASWGYPPSLPWIADAATIIATSHFDIDWERLVKQIRRLHISLAMRESLSYLRNILHAAVPKESIEDLRNMPVGKTERLEYELSTRKPGPFFEPMLYWRRYLRYLQGVRTNGIQSGRMDFLTYLRHTWRIVRLLQEPVSTTCETIGRMWKASALT